MTLHKNLLWMSFYLHFRLHYGLTLLLECGSRGNRGCHEQPGTLTRWTNNLWENNIEITVQCPLR